MPPQGSDITAANHHDHYESWLTVQMQNMSFEGIKMKNLHQREQPRYPSDNGSSIISSLASTPTISNKEQQQDCCFPSCNVMQSVQLEKQPPVMKMVNHHHHQTKKAATQPDQFDTYNNNLSLLSVMSSSVMKDVYEHETQRMYERIHSARGTANNSRQANDLEQSLREAIENESVQNDDMYFFDLGNTFASTIVEEEDEQQHEGYNSSFSNVADDCIFELDL